MHFKPFTDNIIFYDAEFTSLDFEVGELLSVGFVKMNGESLYLEIEYQGECTKWVTENILPTLGQEKVSKTDARQAINDFVGESKPYLMAYANFFDVLYLRKLLCEGSTAFDLGPFHWLPLDISSIFMGIGLHPEDYMKDDYQYIKNLLGIESKSQHTHNALDDAHLLREVYLKLVNTTDIANSVV